MIVETRPVSVNKVPIVASVAVSPIAIILEEKVISL